MPDNVTTPRELLIERFENIYAATYYKLYHFIIKYVRDEASVKDVLQESYIRLWENSALYKTMKKYFRYCAPW